MYKSSALLPNVAYSTDLGSAHCGDSLHLLAHLPDNSIHLAITSPPFALQRKKEYGNKDQHEYIDWLMQFAALVHAKLKPDGSFVLDLGGAYQKGTPTRSQNPSTSQGCISALYHQVPTTNKWASSKIRAPRAISAGLTGPHPLTF